ncbi:MAG: kelch repeat-containing protein [Tannerella sp.]|uniref:kelch repeat-containing protein n=1 Tax=Tannerella sp. TaxID=2382127 RepID=UPI003FA2860E
MGYLFCTKPYFGSGGAGVWQAVKQMPAAIRFPSALTGFGKVFIAHCKSDFIEYDIASGTYTNRGNSYTTFYQYDPGEGLAHLRYNQIYMTTGVGGGNSSRYVVITVSPEFYASQADYNDTIPRHLRACGVARKNPDSVIIFGGIMHNNAWDNTICEINFRHKAAYVKPVTLTRSLSYLSATECNGAYYAAGGVNVASIFSKLIKYTEASNTVEYFDMPAALAGCCLVGHAGKVYIFGGATNANFTGVVNTVYAFDTTSKTWEPLPSMPTAVANAGGCALPDRNEIHVFGGWNGNTMLNTHQILKLS